MDYDLQTILTSLHKDLKTQKILLVGHSQGTYYSNEMYQYLTENGVDKSSVAVYNVATPARFVAGGGDHLNSSTDTLLDALEALHVFKPLYRNINLRDEVNDEYIDLLLTDARRNWPGHSFSDAYLALAPSTVISGVQKGLSKLSATTNKEECFTPPPQGVAYRATQVFFAVADPGAVKVAQGINVAGEGLAMAKDATLAIAGGATYAIGSVFGFFIPESRTGNLPGSHDIVQALYGSSLNEEDLDDLLGSSQGASVAVAVPKSNSPKKEEPKVEQGEVAGVETEKPFEPLVPFSGLGNEISAGFGGGGPSVPSASTEPVAEEETTPVPEESELGSPPEEEPEPTPEEIEEEILPPVETVVYEHLSADSVDGFNLCGGWCSNFTGLRDWSWFKRGAFVFDKARIFLTTSGAGPGEILLSGKLRLHIYATQLGPGFPTSSHGFVRGNLLHTSSWVGLEKFFTPYNECDGHTQGFDIARCTFDFVFTETVVFQNDHAYLFVFEADSIIGSFPARPEFDKLVILHTMCTVSLLDVGNNHWHETCGKNNLLRMRVTFIRVGDGPVSPSPLDITPAPLRWEPEPAPELPLEPEEEEEMLP